jgi:hypothetical protein
MTAITPVDAHSIDGYDAPVRPWSEVQACLDKEESRVRRAWLSTTCPDGSPHAVPLSTIWLEDAFYFNAGGGTRKARNLATNPGSVLTFSDGGFDLVFQGESNRVSAEAKVEELAEVFRSNGWPVRVENSQFYAPFSAPSAGPEPWNLYEMRFSTVFGLGVAEPFGAMRWRF